MKRRSMLFCLDYSHTYRNMLESVCRVTWMLPSPWPNVWTYTVVEMGPRQVERDPRFLKIKNRKKGMWRKLRGARLGEPPRWFRWSKNILKKRARVARGLVEKRPREEDERMYNATIVMATTSCKIARSGKKLKRSFVPPRETENPASFAHMDGSPGWNP